jgi:hypothetical protein
VQLYIQPVTTSNYSAIANSHTLQFTTARTKCSQSAVSSPVVAWWWISTMSSASMLKFLLAGNCPTTNSLLQLSCLYHLGMDSTENTIPLLLFNCCLADRAENNIPLLFFACHCLAMVTVQSPIKQSPPNNEPTRHNIKRKRNRTGHGRYTKKV